MCDTGQISIDRANERIAREEEAEERWQRETRCHECDYCEWTADNPEDPWYPGNYRFGWCKKNEWLLTQDDLDTTVFEWGCFR